MRSDREHRDWAAHLHHSGHGPFGEHMRFRGPRGRGRASRGDVRAAVLLLLAEEPMHGYQLMQAIRERSGGSWTPSPGAIYPTISQLEDEGLVSSRAGDGRKLIELTDTGRQYVEENRESFSDPFAANGGSPAGVELREMVIQLSFAAREVARTGDDAQIQQAVSTVREARRSLYLLLANGSEEASS